MKNNKGLTLIEVIVVVALIGIVTTVVFYPIMFSNKSFNRQNNINSNISDARATMDYLTREIRKSGEVTIISDGTEDESSGAKKPLKITIGSDVYTHGEDKVLFKNDKKVFEKVDELSVKFEEGNKKLVIKLKIGDYELSSYIYMR